MKMTPLPLGTSLHIFPSKKTASPFPPVWPGPPPDGSVNLTRWSKFHRAFSFTQKFYGRMRNGVTNMQIQRRRRHGNSVAETKAISSGAFIWVSCTSYSLPSLPSSLSLSPGPHLIPISLPLSVLLYKNILSSIVEEDLNVSLRRICWHGPTCQIFFN